MIFHANGERQSGAQGVIAKERHGLRRNLLKIGDGLARLAEMVFIEYFDEL